MPDCPICGNVVRDGDDVVEVEGALVHSDCVEAHAEPSRRKPAVWASMGATHQMAMGDVQREP